MRQKEVNKKNYTQNTQRKYTHVRQRKKKKYNGDIAVIEVAGSFAIPFELLTPSVIFLLSQTGQTALE